MPFRKVAAKEFGRLLGVLSHPHRLQIIEELRAGERDVGGIQEILGISHSSVSQHLSLLRAHRLVGERREGRHIFYRLRDPRLADWLLDGLKLLLADASNAEELAAAIQKARTAWSAKRSH